MPAGILCLALVAIKHHNLTKRCMVSWVLAFLRLYNLSFSEEAVQLELTLN
jgi:hypothetical protein